MRHKRSKEMKKMKKHQKKNLRKRKRYACQKQPKTCRWWPFLSVCFAGVSHKSSFLSGFWMDLSKVTHAMLSRRAATAHALCFWFGRPPSSSAWARTGLACVVSLYMYAPFNRTCMFPFESKCNPRLKTAFQEVFFDFLIYPPKRGLPGSKRGLSGSKRG